MSPRTTPLSPDYTLASPDYTLDTPYSNEKSEPIDASVTRTISPSDSTLQLSPHNPLTRTLPNHTPSRAFYYRSTARVVMRTQPTLSLDISARVTEVMTLCTDPLTRPFSTSFTSIISDTSYTEEVSGTSEPILDTKTEDNESQAEVPVKDTTADKPLGLGYGEVRRCALELAEDPVPSTFKVGKSSRSVPDQQVADETHRLPTCPTWVDPKDGTIYIDIEFDAPRVRAPVQTSASPEWSSGSLPVSLASLTIPSCVDSPVTTPEANIK
ncbi:hypothetical protein Tco_1459954 [Tanacetum coccineum]